MVGKITDLGSRKEGQKPNWRWSVRCRADVQHVLAMILPLLGNRRTDRARYVLSCIEP